MNITSIGLLKAAFISEHYSLLFSGEATHEPALRLIAQLVRHTDDETLLAEVVGSGLGANYRGNTLSELPEMIRGALKKGFDQEIPASLKMESMATAAVKLALSNAVGIFHDGNERSFISIPVKNGGQRTLSLSSGAATKWIQSLWYSDRDGAVIPARALSDAIEVLKAKAFHSEDIHPVSIRVGAREGGMYIDLGDPDHSIIDINQSAQWRVGHGSAIKFVRAKSMRELPRPVEGGSWTQLRELLKLPDQQWLLVQAFILGCYRARGPYFCLLVNGEQGSGKSVLCAVLKRIIDPSVIDRLSLPSSGEQLFIQARDEHLLVFDNASWIKDEISDALCRLSTGGAIAKRALYTDDDLHILSRCIPFIINGIGEYSNRPDLLERAILLTLPSMPEGSRNSEKELFERLEEILPELLGCILDAVAIAYRDESQTPVPTAHRMADAARWLSAAEPALGLQKGALLGAIEDSQTTAVADRIRDNSLYRALQRHLEENGAFDGGIGALHDSLLLRMERPDRSFPKTAAHLSSQLQRLAPAMAKAGIIVELRHRGREGRTVVIRWEPGTDRPIRNSEFPPRW